MVNGNTFVAAVVHPGIIRSWASKRSHFSCLYAFLRVCLQCLELVLCFEKGVGKVMQGKKTIRQEEMKITLTIFHVCSLGKLILESPHNVRNIFCLHDLTYYVKPLILVLFCRRTYQQTTLKNQIKS